MKSISSGLVAQVQAWGPGSAFLPAGSHTDQAHWAWHVIVHLTLLA